MFEQYQEMGSGGNEKKVWKVLLVMLLISSLGAVSYAAYISMPISWTIPEAFNVETLPATNVKTNSVTLNGNITHLDVGMVSVWFEYGKNKGIYTYQTECENKTVEGNFSQDIEGIQFMPESTYYFRAAANGSGIKYGEDFNFTMLNLSKFEDKNFSKNYQTLKNSTFNISTLAIILPKTYTDMMLQSHIFYGLFFGLIFMAMWIRSEDVILPALLGMAIGASIFFFLPPTWMVLAQSLLIISLAAGIYSLIKGRK